MQEEMIRTTHAFKALLISGQRSPKGRGLWPPRGHRHNRLSAQLGHHHQQPTLRIELKCRVALGTGRQLWVAGIGVGKTQRACRTVLQTGAVNRAPADTGVTDR